MLAKDYNKGYKVEERYETNEKIGKRSVIKKKRSNNKLRSLILISIFLGGCLLLLSRYAAITSIRSDITTLERNIEELEKKKVNLQASLEGIKSSEKIEEEAILKLGMDYPNEGQIVYLSTTSTENISKDLNYIVKDNFNKLVNGVQVFIRR